MSEDKAYPWIYVTSVANIANGIMIFANNDAYRGGALRLGLHCMERGPAKISENHELLAGEEVVFDRQEVKTDIVLVCTAGMGLDRRAVAVYGPRHFFGNKYEIMIGLNDSPDIAGFWEIHPRILNDSDWRTDSYPAQDIGHAKR